VEGKGVADIETKRGIGTMKEKGTGVDWVAFFTANGVIPEQEVKTALDPIYTLMTKSVMNKMCDGSYYIALASRPATEPVQDGTTNQLPNDTELVVEPVQEAEWDVEGNRELLNTLLDVVQNVPLITGRPEAARRRIHDLFDSALASRPSGVDVEGLISDAKALIKKHGGNPPQSEATVLGDSIAFNAIRHVAITRPAPSNGLTVEDVERIAKTVKPRQISVTGLYDLHKARQRGVKQMKNAIIAELRREG